MRLSSTDWGMVDVTNELLNGDEKKRAEESQEKAQQRAKQLSLLVGSHSVPVSRGKTPVRSPPGSPDPSASSNLPLDLSSISLENLTRRTKYGIEDDTEDDEEDEADMKNPQKKATIFSATADRFVRPRTSNEPRGLFRVQALLPGLPSGPPTPTEEQNPDDYVPRPQKYREGFLSSILKLYNEQGVGAAVGAVPIAPVPAFGTNRSGGDEEEAREVSSSRASPVTSPGTSGTSTPRRKTKWYYRNASPASTGSMGSIASLVSSTTMLAQPATSMASLDHSAAIRPMPKQRTRSNNALDTFLGRGREESIHVQVHLAETISRQIYLLRLCRALMQYGAPTHRLEEYLRMSARVLEIGGSFLYLPGCMMISFDDAATRTTEVKLVRAIQGVDLGKLKEVHEIYKEVVHDIIGVDDAMPRLDEIMNRKPKYSPWTIVLVYGLASACVGPFAFGARPVDLPIAFLLGSLLGIMQLIIAPKSELYSNIFEISAAVLTSFLARAFGSLGGGQLFCFSALAQSSIALILPGYTVRTFPLAEFASVHPLTSPVCGSLELQSRHIVPGSVRMVYAIIYSFFLGYGITIGTSFYGGIDAHATSDITCKGTMPVWYPFLFVAPFTLCLIIINQGKWKDMPMMIFVALLGYVVNYFSAIRFPSNAQIANTLGALAIGIAGNIHSRLRHGLAVATVLPAIFVQVPSGLAATGSLISGVASANQITRQSVQGTTTVSNGTQAGAPEVDVNAVVFNVGYSMIQVAIGITVGLFLGALVVYPFGKRRSGLFSF